VATAKEEFCRRSGRIAREEVTYKSQENSKRQKCERETDGCTNGWMKGEGEMRGFAALWGILPSDSRPLSLCLVYQVPLSIIQP
jgi:hypothetical protein